MNRKGYIYFSIYLQVWIWTTRKTKRSIWTGTDYLQDVAKDCTFMWNLTNNQNKQKTETLINRKNWLLSEGRE